MSVLFQSGVFEYQLPTLVGASEGEVMTVGAQGQLEFAAGGGGGGGLTQSQVYGVGNPIIEIPPASSGQAGDALTLNAQGALEYSAAAGGLTQEEVYGAGNPIIEIPPASAGQAGDALTLNAQGALIYSTAAGGLSQAQVYGAGNPIIEIPPASSGQAGEFLSLNAQGALEYAAGGGAGGLTQEEVYGAGNPIIEIPPASSGTAGEVLTLNAQGGLEYSAAAGGGLTQADVYGAGQPILVIPPASSGTAGQAMVLSNTDTLEYATLLSQQNVYGANAIYQLPDLQTAVNGQVMAVQGGSVVFTEQSGGLQPNQVWAAGTAQYTLPNITGVQAGQSLVATGSNTIEFTFLQNSSLLQYQVYGGTEQSPNTIYTLDVIANAAEGDVLTNVGGQCLWQPQSGTPESEIWANPASSKAKIPDYVGEGALPNSVLTLVNIETGETSWQAQQAGLYASDVWAEPATPPAENYKLPAIGTEGQILTVSSIANTLEFADPPTVASTIITPTFSGQFTGASQPFTLQFVKTGSQVSCAIISNSPIDTPASGTAPSSFTLVPDSYAAIESYMPIADVGGNEYFLCLGYAYQTTGSNGLVRGFWQINPNTGVFTFRSEDINTGTFEVNNSYIPGVAFQSSGVFIACWVSR